MSITRPTHRRPSSALPDGRFESLVSDLCAGFIGIRAPDVDQRIEHGLRRLVVELDLDRAALGEFRDDGGQVHVTHTWTRPGMPSLARLLESATCPWITGRLRRDEAVCFTRPEELPSVAAADRRHIARLGATSVAFVPFMVGDVVGGALGVTTFRRRRRWPEAIVQRLRLLAEVFAVALVRLRAEEDVKREREALAHVLRVATLGELAGSLAHEVNQPLTAILSNAEATARLFATELPPDDERLVALNDIAHEARRASQVVKRLRALFRKDHADRQPVDVTDVLAEVTALLRKDFERRRVRAELHLPPVLPRVQADVVQLQQVMLNLLINAAEAVGGREEDARVVHVHAGLRAPGLLEVAVRDGGVGVDPASLERIFERFVTTKPDGLGMGLSISRSIVQTHGGRIWATRNVDRGLTVHVELPCQAACG